MTADGAAKEFGDREARADAGGRELPATFEEAFARLEEVVGRLERGDVGLEEALTLFEEGVALARLCRRRLDEAEARIRVLVEGSDGTAEEVDAARLEAKLFQEAGDAE